MTASAQHEKTAGKVADMIINIFSDNQALIHRTFAAMEDKGLHPSQGVIILLLASGYLSAFAPSNLPDLEKQVGTLFKMGQALGVATKGADAKKA